MCRSSRFVADRFPRRRNALLGLALAMLLFGLDGAAVAADTPQSATAEKSDVAGQRRPNILLIYTDDQSYKTVGCYPGAFPWARTPNIDSLAQGGIRFAGAYLGSWCMPSRAAMLTGRLPHGIESMRMEGTYPGSAYDPQACPFWPAVFRQHGYQTAHIGKWHTGTDAGTGRDWDHQIVWNRPKHPEDAGNYYGPQIMSFNGQERLVEGYTTDNYTQFACDYIRGEQRAEDKPWYLWLCYGAIHGPSIPAQRHKGMYAKEEVPTPADILPPRDGKPAYLNKTQAWYRDAEGQIRMGQSGEKFGDTSAAQARTHAQFVQRMSECVPAIDEGVGKLIETLRETGQLENTLIVFTADQGFAMGEHGFRTKVGPYDANYLSPLIVSWAGKLPAGKACPQTVSGPDLVATFFAQAGIELPWKMHGRDISPLLTNPQAPWPHVTLYEHVGHHYGSDVTKVLAEGGKEAVHSNVPWYFAIRDGRYKYIRTLVRGEMEEIYDLQADPEELDNLAQKPEHAQRLERMRAQTLDELRRTQADFLDYLPPTAAMLAADE